MGPENPTFANTDARDISHRGDRGKILPCRMPRLEASAPPAEPVLWLFLLPAFQELPLTPLLLKKVRIVNLRGEGFSVDTVIPQ